MLAAAGTAAQAQTAAAQAATAPAEQATDVIVVTGIRGSIERAIKTKRLNSNIVEVVNAEDIGKLPDTSIAESIARLPGLTAQRLNGRDQVITVRGFGPDFTTALLNGREQVTTGDNRGVEYDIYPSELISSVVVAKTPDASLVGQGMVGTVELNTMRPLDQTHRVVAIAARGDMDGYKALNPKTDNDGYRFSGFYADKFANDTLGVAFGGAIQSTPTQNKAYNAWGFPKDSSGNFILGGGKEYGQSDQLDRKSFVGTIQYRPNDRFESTFDAFYSSFDETDYLRGVEFPLAWSGASATTSVVKNGFDAVTTFTNEYPVQRNDYDRRKAQTISLGWNNKYQITDHLRANLDLSWSRAKRKDFLLENYSGVGYNQSGTPDTVTVTQQSDDTYKFAQSLDLTDTNNIVITDPQGWGYVQGIGKVTQAGYVNKPHFTDDLKAIRFDLEGDLDVGPLKNWEAGVNVSRRVKDSAFTADYLTLGNYTSGPNVGQRILSIPIPSAAIIGPASPIGFLGVSPTLAMDPLWLYNHIYTQIGDRQSGDLARQYLVRENVQLYYAKLNIDTNVFNVPTTGNVGFQVVHTDQFSTGVSVAGGVDAAGNLDVANVSGSDQYTNFLPSLNLKFNLTPSRDIRFGAARTLARPRLDQEEITSVINTNINYLQCKFNDPNCNFKTFFSGSGGNIKLHPYLADTVNLTFEQFFGSSGYFSVQGFYQHLTQFVNPSLSHVQDFTAAIPAFLTPAQASQLGTPLGVVSGPGNSGFGDIFGMEVALTVPFKMFTPVLDGFGAELSGSAVDSEVKYTSQDPSFLPIEGQSKIVANSTFYYEKNGFQARVSTRYRSKFLGEISGLSATRNFTTIKAETIVDSQIGYTFQSGPMKNLAILLEGKNLTDQPFVSYEANNPARVTNFQKYGPTYSIGASYKF